MALLLTLSRNCGPSEPNTSRRLRRTATRSMGFAPGAVRAQIPDRRIEWHAVLDSTMTEASRLASSGAPSGTVVGAEEQTAGLGRRGRTWHSEPGSGLYV